MDLVIWVALARLVAEDRLEDNVFGDMPPLLSDFDQLYQQIPEDARERRLLARSDDDAHRESLAQFSARLLGHILPELAARLDSSSTDGERTAMFHASEPALRLYIRNHIFARVANDLGQPPP